MKKAKERVEKNNKAVSDERDFEAICVYCEYAVPMCDSDSMLCRRNGIVGSAYHCSRFIYDPLKRKPAKPLMVPRLDYVDIDGK